MRILDHLDVIGDEDGVDLPLVATVKDDQRRQVAGAELIDHEVAVGVGGARDATSKLHRSRCLHLAAYAHAPNPPPLATYQYPPSPSMPLGYECARHRRKVA